MTVRFRPSLMLVLCAFAVALFSSAQTSSDEYKVFADHPRLLLRPQRLRLLRRERERQTVRWQQLETLVAGKAALPEPGFAWALYYQVSSDANIGRQAVQWALSAKSTDVRQLALVFDWCQAVMDDAQKQALANKLAPSLGPLPANLDIATARSRAFAAIAVADHNVGTPDRALQELVEKWWRPQMQKRLEQDASALIRTDFYALFEMLHAVRDNVNLDLREGANTVFQAMPALAVLRNYPSPYPAPENEFFVPFYDANSDPDLAEAARSRAAGLSIVAFDNNATESQFLQGWLLRDQLMMKSGYGAPYEFLWANQYQPGLSYDKLPLLLHIDSAGLLLARSDWEETATWFADVQGKMQLFADGKRQSVSGVKRLITVGPTGIVNADMVTQLTLTTGLPEQLYVVGLRPGTPYQIELDDEEVLEETADRAGMIPVNIKERAGATLAVHARAATQ